MKRLLIITLSLAALLGCRGEKDIDPGGSVGNRIAFEVGPLFSVSDVETKATEVTSLSAFYVSAVTGSPGSESSAWTSTQFHLVPESDPATYTSDRYWPGSNPSYVFYASNRPLTFQAGGTTVSASNDTDVVCAYLTASSYKTRNTLVFEHIFARLGNVTVTVVPGYSVSDIDIRLTPRTGGTYNIRTGAGKADDTGWSAVTTGPATVIANATGVNGNDVWLVPGNYTLSASWTLEDVGGSTVRYSGKTVDITVRRGAVNTVGVVIGGNISVGVDIIEFVDNECVQNLEPLTFEALGDGNIYWKTNTSSYSKTIEYSKDNGETWTAVTPDISGRAIPVKTGDKVLIRGNETGYGSSSNFCSFGGSVDYYVYGNITDLLAPGFKTRLEMYCFKSLFNSNTHILTHPEKRLVLPSLILGGYSYYNMFYGCSKLTVTPEIRATILSEYSCYAMFYNCQNLTTATELSPMRMTNCCYSNMFNYCYALTTPPQLPATRLAYQCYNSMFNSCTSLTVAPDLPATKMEEECYKNMFSGCTSLTSVPELPATTLANNCYNGMFQNCTSLVTAQDILPATSLVNYCYGNMYRGCTSLTTAPVLPAPSLYSNCYNYMFYQCSSLNYIKSLNITSPSSYYCNNWVSGVAETGTFVKANAANWTVTGNNGVPTGWTVIKESF